MFSYTFGMLKPDCYRRGLDDKIKKMILKRDLRFVLSQKLILTPEQVAMIYDECRKDWYFEEHSRFMRSGPVTAFIVGGEYAIPRLDELVGYTIPSQAARSSIRYLGVDILRNLIHSSANYGDFVRDGQAVFKGSEFSHFFENEYLK